MPTASRQGRLESPSQASLNLWGRKPVPEPPPQRLLPHSAGPALIVPTEGLFKAAALGNSSSFVGLLLLLLSGEPILLG